MSRIGRLRGWLAIKTTEARFTSLRRVVGCVLIYLGILVILHAHLFNNVMNESPNVLQTTWSTLLDDIRRSQVSQNVGGGMVGAFFYRGTYFLVSQIGSYILAVLMIMIGGFLFSKMSSHELLEHLQHAGEKVQQWLEGSPEKQAAREERKAQKLLKKQRKEAERSAVLAEIKEKNQVRPFTEEERAAQSEPDLSEIEPEQLSFVPIDHFQELPKTPPAASSSPASAQEKKKALKKWKMMAKYWNLKFPKKQKIATMSCRPLNCWTRSLQPIKAASTKIEQNIGVLEKTFQSFGVDAKVVKASLGPAVTKFEVQPAVGVKVSKIVGLTDDIALALAAKDVRMEAPIPGKSLIGIEVPNSAVSMVSFREVIEAQPDHPDKLLEVPLGRDISGRVQTADLTKMPHLLIAGSTGSGNPLQSTVSSQVF